MLVIPALLSLKSSVMTHSSQEMALMMVAIGERLHDNAEIVQRTAKKVSLNSS
jgi:hypothetical protein